MCKAVLGIVILKPIITIFIKQKVNPIILWEATSKTDLLQELQAFGGGVGMEDYKKRMTLGLLIMLLMFIIGIIFSCAFMWTPDTEIDPIVGFFIGVFIWVLALCVGIAWSMDMIRRLAEDLLRHTEDKK